MLQIEERRFLQFAQFEEELNKLFQNIVYQYCKEWQTLNPSIFFGWQDKKNCVAEYVNQRIIDNKIIFNGRTPYVWFNMCGSGDMLYWSTNDSRMVEGVDKLLENKKQVLDLK